MALNCLDTRQRAARAGEPSGAGLASPADLCDKAVSETLSRFPLLANPPIFKKGYVPPLKQNAFTSTAVDPSKTLSRGSSTTSSSPHRRPSSAHRT